MTRASMLICDRCGFASERDSNLGFNSDQLRLWTDISGCQIGRVQSDGNRTYGARLLSHLCPNCSNEFRAFLKVT